MTFRIQAQFMELILKLLLTTSVVSSFPQPDSSAHTASKAVPGRLRFWRRQTSTVSTALNLKYKTFDDMLKYHADVPLLIDFYAPWCGPCKLMKDELTKIRPVLDTMGPLISQPYSAADGAEDCNVADAFQSSDCLDTKAENSNNKGDNDTSLLSETKTNNSDKRADQTTIKPSGIPIFHVNANKFPQVGARNKIHGLPTLVLFLKGVEVWRVEGVMSGDEILKSISEQLGRVDDVAHTSSNDVLVEDLVEGKHS